MLKIPVRTEKRTVLDPKKLYGTAREFIARFKVEAKVKDANLEFENETTIGSVGKMLMLIVREDNKAKKFENLKESETIFLSASTADRVRAGEITLSALLDFNIIHHVTNEESTNPGTEMLMIVRPQATVNRDKLKQFAVNDTTEITQAYERNTDQIDDVLSQMQI